MGNDGQRRRGRPGPADPPRHADPGLTVGHLHLHVGDIEGGLAFYRDVLGFEVQDNLGSAAFVSAGG
ncbi:MAG TPA: VOC family protein [Acidimicrobiales bacterium]|nr:VOC family protein [Acidimicrobiales bacterium]